MKQHIKDEIEAYLSSDNLENASKRLLDLTWYYLRDHDLHEQAISVRKSYNLAKTLGQNELENEELATYKSTLQDLYAEIQTVSIEEKEPNHQKLIEIKQLEKHFNHISKKFVFGPVNIDIHCGEIIGVVGENGNGKTTFLRLIQEEISRDQGELSHHYKLENIAASDTYKKKNRTAFIPQRIPKWRGTLMENLIFFAAIHGYKGAENDKIVEYVIHRMGLTAFTGLNWNQISTGYKLRFELAKMLVWEPDVLILDEPLANLDVQATQNLLSDLRFFANSTIHPIGILFTSQQLHEVEQISDKVLFLRNGKPVFCGNREDFEKSRSHHVIELSTKTDTPSIQKILGNKVLKVSGSNAMIRIEFDKDTSTNEVLSTLLQAGVELTYFRDLTNSTVQLFNN